MGVAFGMTKELFQFTDNVKMRIIAPILTAGLIPRKDDNGEFFIKFTTEIVEKLAHLYNARQLRNVVIGHSIPK